MEDRLKAVEIQVVPGLDFSDLGLVPGVVIPYKFKTPVFAKYDGVSCPKLHLRSYVHKIQPHTADRKLWIHFFQESLVGTQLEWFYQLEGSRIHTWEDLATAFYHQYQYNTDLAPTRVQLQNMTMGSNEGFKVYAQKWRDLASRVQPPLTERELVDMFMGTLTGPFFNLLIGSSSFEFTKLILTGERIESGIRSGKIPMASGSTSNSVRRPFTGKKETNVVYGARAHTKKDHHSSVNAVLISNPQPTQRQPSNNQRPEVPRRQFTRISMSLSQALQHLLKANLVTLCNPPSNPDVSSPNYKPNAKCAYHSNSPGHETDQCWALKNKI